MQNDQFDYEASRLNTNIECNKTLDLISSVQVKILDVPVKNNTDKNEPLTNSIQKSPISSIKSFFNNFDEKKDLVQLKTPVNILTLNLNNKESYIFDKSNNGNSEINFSPCGHNSIINTSQDSSKLIPNRSQIDSTLLQSPEKNQQFSQTSDGAINNKPPLNKDSFRNVSIKNSSDNQKVEPSTIHFNNLNSSDANKKNLEPNKVQSGKGFDINGLLDEVFNKTNTLELDKSKNKNNTKMSPYKSDKHIMLTPTKNEKKYRDILKDLFNGRYEIDENSPNLAKKEVKFVNP